MINDGNGLDYAYEYTVHENLPSGIYYYYIEGEKSGRKLKDKGKFAVMSKVNVARDFNPVRGRKSKKKF